MSGWVLNAKVLWVRQGQVFPVEGMHDKPYPMCNAFKRKHENDHQYQGGKLIVVSMTDTKYLNN